MNRTEHSAPWRFCTDCGEDISLLSPKALRCKRCAYEREKEKARERGRINYHANREIVLQRVKEHQQTPGYKQKREKWRERNPEKLLVYRDRERQSHRAKTGYNPKGRKCQKCHVVDISDRGHRAKYCDDCEKPPTRTCEVCKKPFKAQGSRTQYCDNPQCKQAFQQLQEQQGDTKICTKCKETKAHTEFRLHYGLRGSVCKRCEADATHEYYQGLPVEERQQRRRIQGQREKHKYDNLPSRQRAERRAKDRKAELRRKFGPNYDVDRLYLEQDGKCALCRKPAPLEDLEVDHDHKTHVKGTMHSVRGLLCKNCNLKLVPRYENGFPSETQDWPYMNEYLARGKQL